MSKEVTIDKKAKFEANSALIKHVFDNLRNLFYSVTLTLIGGAILKYGSDQSYFPYQNVVVGFFIILIAVALFAWNCVHGMMYFSINLKNTWKRWLFVPLFTLYFFVANEAFHISIRLQAAQQLKDGVIVPPRAPSNKIPAPLKKETSP